MRQEEAKGVKEKYKIVREQQHLLQRAKFVTLVCGTSLKRLNEDLFFFIAFFVPPTRERERKKFS